MPKRDAAHMGAQREKFIRAAIECIAEKGIERSSISDICEKAQLSPGALYVHFANKDEILVAALRYGTMTEATLPDTWQEFQAMASSLADQLDFDIATVVRVRLHLHAESARPGKLHDLYKPFLETSVRMLTERLQLFADRDEIQLRMDARQTALSISALIDGMLWNALATDRSFEQTQAALAEGLEMFVIRPPAKKRSSASRSPQKARRK
jgi:AcrR family transcriptional regulator